MLQRVGETVDPKDAVVKSKTHPFLHHCLRTGVQFTGSWQLEHRTYGNAGSRGNSDLCLRGQLHARRCADSGGNERGRSFFFCHCGRTACLTAIRGHHD